MSETGLADNREKLMELLLWRWSTIVQISSDLMIVLFFLSLARSTQRVELRPWVNAWLANLGALSITVVYWLWQPNSVLEFKVISGLYIYFKTLFVMLLLRGVQSFVGYSSPLLRAKRINWSCAVFALFGALLIPSINWLGTVQSTAIAIGLAYGSWLAVYSRSAVLGWIVIGFSARAALAIFETLGYFLSAIAPDFSINGLTLFLAAHSSFDSAAEWCIALGCALALYRTIQLELTVTCDKLVDVKNELQDLVDRDALTGLGNRRTLRHVLEKARQSGATILFFDLNNFKQINDRYGHKMGDECLQRFALALMASFRPDDHVIRYAGDEFVVVSIGLTPEATLNRIETTRKNLRDQHFHGPKLQFSVGSSYLPVDGEPDRALHEADEAMYLNKKNRL